MIKSDLGFLGVQPRNSPVAGVRLFSTPPGRGFMRNKGPSPLDPCCDFLRRVANGCLSGADYRVEPPALGQVIDIQ